MGAGSFLAKTAGGIGVGAVAAVAAGVVVERRVVKARRAAGPGASTLASLRSPARAVTTTDGLTLHAEIDEIAPYEGKARVSDPGVTLVFAHGYCLNLDCWHFQREALRGKHRMVFYDQRSHGRSEHSDREDATIDQLGHDLASVLEQLVPDGKLILVGHSMGGMSIMAFAQNHPEMFAERVAGVALISTTAGDLEPHRILSRFIPRRLGVFAAPRVIAALASAPELVDSARRRGSNIGFLVADQFAFGGEAPAEEVEFLDVMLAGTSMTVIAEFFPTFNDLDKYDVLGRLDAVPTTIICGTSDRVTSIGHSRTMAKAMPHARLVECQGAGHMVIFEARDIVNREIEALVAGALKRS